MFMSVNTSLKKEKFKVFSVRLPQYLVDELDKIAKDDDRNRNSLIAVLLKQSVQTK